MEFRRLHVANHATWISNVEYGTPWARQLRPVHHGNPAILKETVFVIEGQNQH
jgi:hypothetical protein